jgi:hypothetical protein
MCICQSTLAVVAQLVADRVSPALAVFRSWLLIPMAQRWHDHKVALGRVGASRSVRVFVLAFAVRMSL